MINFDFLPSRQISLYMARLFITRSLAVLLALVLVLMTLDLLGESSKILAVPGNSEADLWHYVGLRLPLLAARFLPFSVLLGTLIAFTTLNQNSEVVAMKAAGLSAHQILAPMIIASAFVAIGSFAFNETIVVRSAREVSAWSNADYKKVPAHSGAISNVWLLSGDDLVHVDLLGGRGDRLQLRGVRIYDRGGGSLMHTIEAESAVRDPKGGGWVLRNVRTYDATQNVVRRFATMPALPGVTPDRFTLAKVIPAEQNFSELGQSIDELEAAGRPTDEALTGWWHKLSGPLSTVLMPLLAAMAAFGLARSGQVLLRATIGMALGFTYFVADNFSIALGNVGAYPPVLAAWAPFFLFLLIGETVLIRTEE
jgi:lipopolysaccharide export system permease protein